MVSDSVLVSDLMKSLEEKTELEEKRKKYILWYLFYKVRDIYYYTRSITIKDIYNEIKWFLQRGFCGWSDRDTWDLYNYIAKVIFEGIKHLKKYQTGIPAQIANKYENGDEAEIEWQKILDVISFTFETAQHIGDSLLLYDKKGLSENMKKYWKMLSKKDTDKFWKGFDLFKKHFFSL